MTDTTRVPDAFLLPPLPRPDLESQGFWDGLAADRLDLCRCTACRTWMQPPLERCRRCGAETAFETTSGRGTVFSHIVVRHPAVPGHPPPYVIALVDIDEQPGVRLTGVLDVDPEATIEIGMPVVAEIRDIGDSELKGVWWVPG